jgi:hypothetical protein
MLETAHIPLLIGRRKEMVRAALVTAAVMLIPLWGNLYAEGWDWDSRGFVVAGAFVFSAALTYELVARTMRNTAYRFAVGLAVVTAFVFWNTGVARGVVRVIGLNGVFAVLFAMSALLFRRAARTHEMSPTGLESSCLLPRACRGLLVHRRTLRCVGDSLDEAREEVVEPRRRDWIPRLVRIV